MAVPYSLDDVLTAFRALGPTSQKRCLQILGEDDGVRAIMAKIVASDLADRDVLEGQIRTLRVQVKLLELEKESIKNQPKIRMSREERKQRMLELKNRKMSARQIAEELTRNGEPINPEAVKKALQRLRTHE
jgi:repressor of nif and glnA expression